ncbi:hypothetical protein PROFUN_10559 [Planoprotostelium fungivorum]|uniref:Uncharacterized protein n=1 Tax=Planoprotostelium fungivorum TaxID=1890364 RepID=A0A2P6N6S9_9EUKA|nr:hypothetical protein PROFUN_10559 [Planoprotostelium fungivorum]
MRKPIKLQTSVLLLVCYIWCLCDAFRYGDVVRMSRRSQTKQGGSDWIDITAQYCPKFRMRSTVNLLIDSETEFANSDLSKEVKMSFAFDDRQLLVPYLSVSSKEGVYLESIEFKFSFSEDKVVEVDWTTHYSRPQELREPPKTVYVHYDWYEHSQKHTDFARDLFLVLNFLFIGVYVLYLSTDIMRER